MSMNPNIRWTTRLLQNGARSPAKRRPMRKRSVEGSGDASFRRCHRRRAQHEILSGYLGFDAGGGKFDWVGEEVFLPFGEIGRRDRGGRHEEHTREI